MVKFNKLEKLFLAGLLGVAITQEAFSAEQLFSRTQSRFMSRMPLRLFPSAAPVGIDLTAEWNKGYVPPKKVLSHLSPKFSSKDLAEPIVGPLPLPTLDVETVQHSAIASRQWYFDPQRSLPFYRDYYDDEEAKKHKDQNVRLVEPVAQDGDTVKFSLQKLPQKNAEVLTKKPAAQNDDAVEFPLKKK